MDEASQPVMALAEAAELLELPDGGAAVDDDMVITMYNLQEADNPSARDRLHRALGVLAESRNSQMLRHFHATGEISAPSGSAGMGASATISNDMQGFDLGHPELPAGLNNIGNTCYLNSVLQYFYAVRPLRDKVIKASQDIGESASRDTTSAAASTSTGSSWRVGGRAVTEYEVKRSRRFVRLLAQLFDAMMTSPLLAVSPERELAYLALVSARVEELEGLQQETPLEVPGPEWPQYSIENSVNLSETALAPRPDAVGPSSPVSPVQPNIAAAEHSTSTSVAQTPAQPETSGNPIAEGPQREEDVTMEGPESSSAGARSGLESRFSSATPEPVAPPPLPPRPPRVNAIVESSTPSTAATGSRTPPLQRSRRNSLMTLGAQQDVSECLNNVLFQIEIALGPGSDAGTSQPSASRENSTLLDGPQASLTTLPQQDPESIEEQGNIAALFTGKTSQKVEPLLSDGDDAASASLGPSPAPSPTHSFAPHRSNSHNTHIKNEIFSILPVDVFEEEGRDIYDGLDGFFEEETLESSDGSRVRRSVNLLEPPPILQIQLQRVQFDRVRGVAYKTQAHLEMGEELYMDRYMHFDPSRSERDARMAAKRKRAIAIRTEIRQARERLAVLRGPSGADAHRTGSGPSSSMCAATGQPPAPASVSKTLALTAKSLRELAKLPPIEIPARQARQADANGNEDVVDGDGGPQGEDGNADAAGARAQPSTCSDDVQGPSADLLPNAAEAAEEEEVSRGYQSTDFTELITDDLCGFLEEEGRAVEAECKELEQRILALKREVEQIWMPAGDSDEGRQVAYRLMSVFMHRGEASHGHYFLNQRRVSSPASQPSPTLAPEQPQVPEQEAPAQPAPLPLGESQQQQTQGDADVTMEAASQQLDLEFPSLQDAGADSQAADESNKENTAPAAPGGGNTADDPQPQPQPQPQPLPEVPPRPPNYTASNPTTNPFADPPSAADAGANVGANVGANASSPSSSTWFKYNDRDVTPVSLRDVLRDTTGATPYLLCYVRQDLQERSAAAGSAAAGAGAAPVFESLKRVVDLGGFALDAPGAHLPPAPIPSPSPQETAAGAGAGTETSAMDTSPDAAPSANAGAGAGAGAPEPTTLAAQIAAAEARQAACGGVPEDGLSTPPLPPEFRWEGVGAGGEEEEEDDVKEVRLEARQAEASFAGSQAGAGSGPRGGGNGEEAVESGGGGGGKDAQGDAKAQRVLQERNA